MVTSTPRNSFFFRTNLWLTAGTVFQKVWITFSKSVDLNCQVRMCCLADVFKVFDCNYLLKLISLQSVFCLVKVRIHRNTEIKLLEEIQIMQHIICFRRKGKIPDLWKRKVSFNNFYIFFLFERITVYFVTNMFIVLFLRKQFFPAGKFSTIAFADFMSLGAKYFDLFLHAPALSLIL